MTTLSFEDFWRWLVDHPNCLIRVGTPDAVLYDDADLHWYLGPDSDLLVAQAIRGKRLIGEVIIDPERITYVTVAGEEREGEHLFELVSETDSTRVVAYLFVMAHGIEAESAAGHRLAVH